MLEIKDGSLYSGNFKIDGKDIHGELTFAGPDTNLFVHSSDFFRPDHIQDQCVHGVLRDHTRVSLFDCLAPAIPARSWSQALGVNQTARIQPHFILHGARHLSPGDRLVKSVSFVLKDAPAIFKDYDSFSHVLNAKPTQLRGIIRETQKTIKRRIEIGKNPEILYFTGNYRIFKAKTSIGTVLAEHQPTINSGGPEGVWIKNRIRTKIAFSYPTTFEKAIQNLRTLLGFFTIIAGRRQELASLTINLKEKNRTLSYLDVYNCHGLAPNVMAGLNLHAIDLPIDAVREPRAFANVLINWLERREPWKAARNRFLDSFTKENTFSPDRLIGSANMFDLLPSSAVPNRTDLAEELQKARECSQAAFKKLPKSIERDSLLNALGRLGQPTLKRKIQHCAQPVIESFGDKLPNFIDVLNLAVDARNYFVHGTETDIDYVENFFKTVVFFSTSLEFLFMVSDLLLSGWDATKWRKNGLTHSHPLGIFLANYTIQLEELRQILPDEHKLNTIT